MRIDRRAIALLAALRQSPFRILHGAVGLIEPLLAVTGFPQSLLQLLEPIAQRLLLLAQSTGVVLAAGTLLTLRPLPWSWPSPWFWFWP